MTTLIALALAMTLIAVLAVITARLWPHTITWVHVGVAISAPIAAEIVHLVIR